MPRYLLRSLVLVKICQIVQPTNLICRSAGLRSRYLKRRILNFSYWIKSIGIACRNGQAVKYLNRVMITRCLKALILLRHDQLQYERYTALADEFMVIKLDANATEYGAGDNCIIINPESEQHFAKLRAYIADSDHDAIIHAASIDNSDMLESALSYGFYSLFLTRSYLLNATQFKNFWF